MTNDEHNGNTQLATVGRLERIRGSDSSRPIRLARCASQRFETVSPKVFLLKEGLDHGEEESSEEGRQEDHEEGRQEEVFEGDREEEHVSSFSSPAECPDIVSDDVLTPSRRSISIGRLVCFTDR